MDRSIRQKIIYPFVLAPIFIWVGSVCSISFMEAWLKFRAPNVSLPIGLGIGRLVFASLNKVEWVLAALTVAVLAVSRCRIGWKKAALLGIPIFILAVQTALLLPLLYTRAELIIQGASVPPSSVHIYYILLESIKVGSVFALGIAVILDLSRSCRDGSALD